MAKKEEKKVSYSEAQASTDAMFAQLKTATDLPVEPNADDQNPATSAKKKSKSKKKVRQFSHGAKHREVSALVDKNKNYAVAEAIELLKKTAYAKFDGSVDLHVRLTEAKKTEDAVRGTITLPHGTGRERRVILITEELIEKIEKGWLDFDVAVATPEMMPKLAKLAKILGPKGKMPNPKVGTVTAEPDKAIAELKGGRVEFKADSLGNIHQSIGKVSWEANKLIENLEIFLAALPKSRIKSISIAPSMGIGIKLNY